MTRRVTMKSPPINRENSLSGLEKRLETLREPNKPLVSERVDKEWD